MSSEVTKEQVLAVADWLGKARYDFMSDTLREVAEKKFKPREPTTRERLAEKLREAYCNTYTRLTSLPPFGEIGVKEREAYLAEADAALEFVRELIEDAHDVFDGENGRDYEAGAIDHERAILRRLS